MVREPRLVEWGTRKTAEHGLGVGRSIGRLARVRPLLRFEAENPVIMAGFFCESRWYRDFMLALAMQERVFYWRKFSILNSQFSIS